MSTAQQIPLHHIGGDIAAPAVDITPERAADRLFAEMRARAGVAVPVNQRFGPGWWVPFAMVVGTVSWGIIGWNALLG